MADLETTCPDYGFARHKRSRALEKQTPAPIKKHLGAGGKD